MEQPDTEVDRITVEGDDRGSPELIHETPRWLCPERFTADGALDAHPGSGEIDRGSPERHESTRWLSPARYTAAVTPAAVSNFGAIRSEREFGRGSFDAFTELAQGPCVERYTADTRPSSRSSSSTAPSLFSHVTHRLEAQRRNPGVLGCEKQGVAGNPDVHQCSPDSSVCAKQGATWYGHVSRNAATGSQHAIVAIIVQAVEGMRSLPLCIEAL